MSEHDKKKRRRLVPKRDIGDTELEMKAIPFFIDKPGAERVIEDTPTISEFRAEPIAEFDDGDDDTVNIEVEDNDLTDATGTLFDDDPDS